MPMLIADHVAEVVDAATDLIFENDGCTLSLTGDDTPTRGYAVSLAGFEEVHELDDEFIGYLVSRYIEKHREELSGLNRYFGAWIDGSRLVLDVSVIVRDFSDAVALAYQHGQQAIYNLARGEEIRMDDLYGRTAVAA
ncbi:hypothetical protein [Kineococcus esterisolvens]|uniref:hypothetical protein n=1 Tax=unclassified Kineococcus TaxID=2621656 RepID=UPI003D7DD48C